MELVNLSHVNWTLYHYATTAVTDQVYRKDDQGRVYKYCKFYDPKSKGFILRRGHFSRIVKMQYFFKNLLYP